MSEEITRVAIVGEGTVGTALAAMAAEAGIEVVTGAHNQFPDLSGCQLVIEAAPEIRDVKESVISALVQAAPADAVIVTTTSTLGLTDLALATGATSRLVGWAPPLSDGSALVEIGETVLVADSAVAAVAAFAEATGRTVINVADRSGFINARLLLGYLNHAIGMVQNGYASKEDVDAAMRFGCGYPVGPIAMADMVGLDVLRDSLTALYVITGERVHAPAPILKQYVAAGRLGRKSGSGFYTYAAPGSAEVVADVSDSGGTSPAAPRSVQSVGVIGSGTMATGIIEVFAKSGFDVTFVARGDEKVARVTGALTKSLDKQVDKGRLTGDDRDAVLARVSGVTSVDGLDQVDLVVEAVVEDLAVKLDLFRNLDRVCKPGAILATTTSSLPVIEMAAVTSRPGDVVGLHFFNPATIMKLVEIVRTTETAADVVATSWDICARTKKVGVECGDRGGFIVNALLFPYLNDAVRLMDAHYASKAQIDTAIKAGTGFPMGPFALLDVVGNDVSLAIQEVLLAEFNDPGFEPAQSLRDVVAAGFLGRKTGRGFYDYAR